MSEDLTQNLPSRPFEERVLAELSAIRGDINRLDARLTNLESKVDQLDEKVDRRLQETRPIREDVQLRLHRLESKFDIVLDEHNELRLDQKLIGRRLTQLEGRRAE